MSVYFCFPHAVEFSTFMICVHLLLCWLCVSYVSLGVTCDSEYFGCMFMGCVVYFLDVVWCYIP